MFCSKCGSQLEEGQQVCLKCGSIIQPNTDSTTNKAVGTKSKIVAGVLGLFLGCFGVHNFYLGYTSKAVGQLLLTVLTCGILSPVSYIWAFIESILILTGNINQDAQGNPLSD